MKKWAKAFIICFAIIVAAVVITFGVLSLSRAKYKEYALEAMDYKESIEQLDMMENSWQTAVPQTTIHELIKQHFDSPLPEGKTEKKAIVIGYDGCRVDNFRALKGADESAVNTLLKDGGHAVFSYCGGVNYPEKNTQDTSTAPGWCSMLTGVLADTHGIYGNGTPKEIEPKTLLLELVEDKTIDSSAFYVSWAGHFTNDNSTYINEKKYIEENNINSVFLRATSDEGTVENVLNDLNSKDCSDFIFLTLEYTDHTGHSTGFSPLNGEYIYNFNTADKMGKSFIDAIKARSSYENEDWLILITTDHGGINLKHGGPSMEERITFIVSNQEILK